jgi:hypothetical protein
LQLEEARELRKEWGNKPCDHPRVVKEYYLGTSTGDYVCTTCGTSGWGRNWNKPQQEND